MINAKQFQRSLKHAIRGMVVVFGSEQSFRLQVFAAILVLALAVWFRIEPFEWIILLLLIGIILSLELINSIFERIVDSFKPRIHPIVRDIKDIMAAAVLVMSLLAIFVGAVIFYPHVLALVGAK